MCIRDRLEDYSNMLAESAAEDFIACINDSDANTVFSFKFSKHVAPTGNANAMRLLDRDTRQAHHGGATDIINSALFKVFEQAGEGGYVASIVENPSNTFVQITRSL